MPFLTSEKPIMNALAVFLETLLLWVSSRVWEVLEFFAPFWDNTIWLCFCLLWHKKDFKSGEQTQSQLRANFWVLLTLVVLLYNCRLIHFRNRWEFLLINIFFPFIFFFSFFFRQLLYVLLQNDRKLRHLCFPFPFLPLVSSLVLMVHVCHVAC